MSVQIDCFLLFISFCCALLSNLKTIYNLTVFVFHTDLVKQVLERLSFVAPIIISSLFILCFESEMLVEGIYVDLGAAGVNSNAHNRACDSLNVNMACSRLLA